ncbi:trypsin-like peptidase domain-containing protein [Waterburya agarophytonicola K14]|uniref:Trypsin-like peptidase domain-containing protein n=1 Tax=Waterburya agarophytonicola KI4 TaxID=2874699 RepID=A0A964BMY1_9CYAN|nr:HhoA/HhoB/HtrA family serine endopeptidase [Waterburya agarophytonicola]MCC0176343.1 trypsin-like peptidase domain-containing protein [Waterburya agarophytonicola KI4]
MKKQRFLGKVASHAVALFLGVILTFSSIRVMSSNADMLPADSKINYKNNPIALKTEPQIQAQAPVSSNSGSFVAAAIAQTGPAVVRIDTEKTVATRAEPFFEDPFFREFFGDRFNGQIPQERQVRGQGSGFITQKNGIIFTNAHVVSGADRVTVTLKDGREFEGVVKGTDEVTDLAVVKIDPRGVDLPIAPLGNSDNVRVGDWAIAVGNPVGLNNTVTLGIISTLTRSSAQVGIPDKRIDFLQTDAAINPGNSGGPLLNERGEVIGINTAIRPDANGIGFAIPIDKAKSITDTLAAGQQVPHPYIGVQMRTLTPELAQRNNKNPNSPFTIPEVEGVLIVRVLPGTPAEAAGLRIGDAITAIDGKSITYASELQSVVDRSGLNQSLNFTVMRGDRTLKLKVVTTQLQGIS